MPTHDYRCPCGRTFEEWFAIGTAPKHLPCVCGKIGERQIGTGVYAGATPDWQAYRSDRLPKNLPRNLVPRQDDGKAVIESRHHEDRVLKSLGYDRE